MKNKLNKKEMTKLDKWYHNVINNGLVSPNNEFLGKVVRTIHFNMLMGNVEFIEVNNKVVAFINEK